MVLTSESVDENIWCDHSNKSFWAVGAICFVLFCCFLFFAFYKMKFRNFVEFLLW